MKLWAKYNDQTGERHLLIHHLADVAAVGEALFSLPVLKRRLARTGGRDELSPVVVERLSFFVALHDLGKCNSGFQRKIRGEINSGGHVGPCLLLFNNERIQPLAFDALNIDQLAAWCGGLELAAQLLLTTFSHHGRPIKSSTRWDQQIWLEGSPDPLVSLGQLVREVSVWFPSAFEDNEDFLPTNPEFQHAFNGLVTLADWIGSDTRFFPFSENAEDDRIGFARENARKALSLIGTDSGRARAVIIKEMPGFEDTFGHETPRSLQTEVCRLNISDTTDTTGKKEDEGSITILEAETGSGKTEAAFLHFQRLFRVGQVDGMYFALPTRAAATQIHRRIFQYTRNTFGAAAPPVILAVPDYIRVDEREGDALPDFKVLWPDQDRFRYRGWAGEHPKRYMAGFIIVGTIDQALLSVLQVSHAQMRFTALTRLLLVVDEVHASDTYMGKLLEEVLRRHTSIGGHALLLSATLGVAARTRYLLLPKTRIPGLEEAKVLPYPAINYIKGHEIPVVGEIKKEGRDKEVEIEIQPLADEPEAIAELALRETRKGGRVLILRNLVKDVIQTQVEVERLCREDEEAYLFHCRGVITPHHGRYAGDDRKVIDNEIERRFGKGSAAGAGLVVASRTVEQSLDIDFDLIITDLAPVDVLLQRIGRLHRHERRRPSGFENPHAIILVPPDRDLSRFIIEKGEYRGGVRGPIGLGTVFDNLLIIEATLRILEDNALIRVPDMNRFLVEMATHPEKIEAIKNDLGGIWEEHFNKVRGQDFARGGAARLALLDHTSSFDEIGFTELDARVATRLGENDRIATFSEPVISPFGNRIITLKIPGWMAHGCADEELFHPDFDMDDGTIIFFCCGKEFIYDRLGLRLRRTDV